MLRGDLITSVDFTPASEEPGIMGVLREKGPGEVLVLDVLRDGKDVRLKLVLGEFPLDLMSPEGEGPRWAPPSSGPVPPEPPMPDAPVPGAVMRHAGQAERAFLGVRLQGLTAGLAVFLGLPANSHGVLVEHVHEDSPAAAAGLKAGDVLLAFEGEGLHEMNDLGEQLRRRSPGDEVRLDWWSRKDEAQSAVARLDARQKEIWVVSPPDREGQRKRQKFRSSLESRLRMLEEQSRRVEQERSSVKRKLEEMLRESEP